jgi:polyhydroxyalkanoate synthase
MKSFSEQLSVHQQMLSKALETLSTLNQVVPDSLEGKTLLTVDAMQLRYYAPHKTKSNAKTKLPLLICYALVNRPYILDLEPKRSLIRDLLSAGHPVYLIDWGYPSATDRNLGLDDYICDYLHSAVEAVKAHSDQPRIDLLGVCQGGVFSLCYAQLEPENVRKLITLVTPIDTEVENFTLAQMVRRVDIATLVKAQGNISGGLLNQLYASLKPLALGLHKQLNLAQNLAEPEQARTFMRMEHWLNDSPDLAGRGAVEFAQGFFQQNGLMNRSLEIAGRRIDLSELKQPILNAYGSSDHLVPSASSKGLKSLAAQCESYEELELKGGHIGAFISSRTRSQLVKAITEFLK